MNMNLLECCVNNGPVDSIMTPTHNERSSERYGICHEAR